MRMSRYLITRLVAVSAAILFAGLALALWRAQYDVQREERGALEIVRLFEHLYAIENGPAGGVDAHIDALRRINDEGNLRHIQLDLRDADGTTRVGPVDRAPSGALARVFALIAPGMRSTVASVGSAQPAHGCPARSVMRYGSSSSTSSRRRAIGKDAVTPTCWSRPSS